MRLSARALVAGGAALAIGLSAFGAATQAGAATSIHWAPAAKAAVHPGVVVTIAGVKCVAGYVMTDGHRAFISVPASCAGVDDGAATDGCTAAQVPYGLKVSVQGARYRGRIAYSSYTQMQLRGLTASKTPNKCANNALVLIRLDDRDIKRTNPSVPAPTGGPTGVASTAPAQFAQLTAYVNNAPTQGLAMQTTGAGWASSVAIGSVDASQLGAPVLTDSGKAVGMVTLVPSVPGGPATVSSLAKEIAFLQTVRGFRTVHLARGTMKFTAA